MESAKLLFNPSFFKVEVGIHHQKNVIWVRFPKDVELIAMLKAATKPRWSQTQKSTKKAFSIAQSFKYYRNCTLPGFLENFVERNFYFSIFCASISTKLISKHTKIGAQGLLFIGISI